MPEDLYAYDEMVENALRGVVREALTRAARHGLRGDHHFYVTFRTAVPGVAIPSYLLTKYPHEMTIVLQHQFWDLTVSEAGVSVTLSFQGRPERLSIPFAAVTGFADPSVQFGLQFGIVAAAAEKQPEPPPALPAAVTPAKGDAQMAAEASQRPAAEIVTLDKFRKR
jgi:hypothetical protein